MVYIAEAHPGSIIAVPTTGGRKELEIIPPTSSVAERLKNLRQFISISGLTMPAVIDDDEESARRAYAAWPDRFYIIGADGKIALKGAPGPTGFKVPELAAWLQQNVR